MTWPGSHWLDHLVALASGRARVYRAGWGDASLLASLATPARFEEDPPAIRITWRSFEVQRSLRIRDGSFPAPVAELPAPARTALVRHLAPAAPAPRPRPVYVVLASSGEEGFAMRERLWRPLVAEGEIEVVLLENAMYGARRPEGQRGADVRTVSDQLLMNVSMVEEARALLDWLAREGHDRTGIAGYSMGGSMAALVAAVTPRPIAAAVFAAGRSGVPVFTEGLLSRGIDHAALGASARARLGEIFGVADLDRHPTPRRPEAAVLVGARRDGYVRAAEVTALHHAWPGSELRWLDTGHAGGLLFRGDELRRAARDAMARLA